MYLVSEAWRNVRSLWKLLISCCRSFNCCFPRTISFQVHLSSNSLMSQGKFLGTVEGGAFVCPKQKPPCVLNPSFASICSIPACCSVVCCQCVCLQGRWFKCISILELTDSGFLRSTNFHSDFSNRFYLCLWNEMVFIVMTCLNHLLTGISKICCGVWRFLFLLWFLEKTAYFIIVFVSMSMP